MIPPKESKLEFPDWNGMKPHRVSMSPSDAFDWNEEMLALFPRKKTLPRKSLKWNGNFKL